MPAHYYATGLYHDGVSIPMFSSSPLSATTHICVTSFSGNKYTGFVATGKADQNGWLWFRLGVLRIPVDAGTKDDETCTTPSGGRAAVNERGGRGMMKNRTLFTAAIAVVAFTVAVGSAGGKSSSTGASVVLQPLIGTSENDVQQVTFGGKIGFHLDVTNTGTSTFNHLVIVVASTAGSFSDASQSNCAADPQDAKRMVCKIPQMQGGAPRFSVDLRFNAPTSGSTVVATPSLTVDAKSQGSPGNNRTQTTPGDPVTTALVPSAGNSLVKTFAKGKEALETAATLLQHSKFTMPNALLGGFYGVETSVQETTGTPLCAKCPALVTLLDIPASLLVPSPFSPTNPFLFTITLLPDGWPSGYNPTGLYHDGVLVPMCDVAPLSSTTTVCLTLFKAKKQNGIVAEGKAYKNGKNGFG